jgi:hypothetical protein
LSALYEVRKKAGERGIKHKQTKPGEEGASKRAKKEEEKKEARKARRAPVSEEEEVSDRVVAGGVWGGGVFR